MTINDALAAAKRRHLTENPACPYGVEAHYVPPGFGAIGFFMCQPLEQCPDSAMHAKHVWGSVGQQRTCPGKGES